MLSRLRSFFSLGPRDPHAGGFGWTPRFVLGYPFILLCIGLTVAVCLMAAFLPKLPRAFLFPFYAMAVFSFGLGCALALVDVRWLCKMQLREFWV